ncbi:SET domain-containing protein [Delitschia confertaspora ATCC 74209]|uniref:SET domain-containing protein n=1 Tax=Delitschia confertaspora ATCC 74209 TaxID=1513339 RepID=A0A9P4MRF3_9PLEO|nr:SET domain-containing protein [Delitschia confertaspora ATCC 74209]
MPWTRNPFCIPVKSDSDQEEFCTYTNNGFAQGRGITFITTPNVAVSVSVSQHLKGDQTPQNEENERIPHPLYEPRETSGRGIGLYATTSIHAGQIIMLSSPVLVINRNALDQLSRSLRHKLQRKALAEISAETRKIFFSLARSKGGEEIDDIIQTNSIRLSLGGDVGHLAVVPEAARINHACRPNSYYRFNTTTLLLEVFALRDIDDGEELTFSCKHSSYSRLTNLLTHTTYGYSTQPSSTRQKLLKQHWSFTCTCPLCSSSPSSLSASNERLRQISEIQTILPTLSPPSKLPQLATNLIKLIDLYSKEDLIVEKPKYEEILVYTYAQMGNEEETRYWGERAQKGWEIVAGKGSFEVRRMEGLLGDVRGHGAWGGGRGGEVS